VFRLLLCTTAPNSPQPVVCQHDTKAVTLKSTDCPLKVPNVNQSPAEPRNPESERSNHARARPGGRSQRIRENVANACLGLLAEGRLDFGPAEVAERSGVSRTTVYRWWPTQPDLLREALTLHTRRLDPPDTGSWPGDVYALIAQLTAFFSDPIELAQNAIIASGAHPEFTRFQLEYYEPTLAAWRQMVRRGIERGEVAVDVDPDTVIALIASPLLTIPLLQRRSPRPDEVIEIGKLVLRATGTTARSPEAREPDALYEDS
jgi:AcrR family transcriptional regulator